MATVQVRERIGITDRLPQHLGIRPHHKHIVPRLEKVPARVTVRYNQPNPDFPITDCCSGRHVSTSSRSSATLHATPAVSDRRTPIANRHGEGGHPRDGGCSASVTTAVLGLSDVATWTDGPPSADPQRTEGDARLGFGDEHAVPLRALRETRMPSSGGTRRLRFATALYGRTILVGTNEHRASPGHQRESGKAPDWVTAFGEAQSPGGRSGRSRPGWEAT